MIDKIGWCSVHVDGVTVRLRGRGKPSTTDMKAVEEFVKQLKEQRSKSVE